MAKRLNILFLMADQLAASFLPAYGQRVVKSPNIDALAEKGVVFDSFYCASPLCAPSRFTMMAGAAVSRIGAYDNAAEFASDVPTFAHYLRAAGYRTALAGKMHFCGADQLHGFEERYTPAASEDTDLGLRAEAMGLVPEFAVRDLVHPDAVRASVLEKVRDQRRWADLALLMRDNSGRERNLLYKRWFWRRTHVDLIATVAGLMLAPRSPRALLLALPWLHGKLSDAGTDRSTLETVIALPGLFAIDTAEVVTVLRGSLRYRFLIV